MSESNTNIEFLISAFAYPYSSLMETFYLRKRDLKVVGVHMFDYSLVYERGSGYKTGLTPEQDRDIKEAIIASEKDYDTHVVIPRLQPEERFQIMNEFVSLHPKFERKLKSNVELLMKSVTEYDESFRKKGIKHGVSMEYLTHKINSSQLKSDWTKFYREKVKTIALGWLEEQKKLLGD